MGDKAGSKVDEGPVGDGREIKVNGREQREGLGENLSDWKGRRG